MRGGDELQSGIFSYVTMEQRIAADHSVRSIRAMVDRALERMDAELWELYSTRGRPSIAPERLLRAQLLMVLYSIRSERQLMEQLNYNLLFRWFVGLEMDDPVWDVTVFTKNRERLTLGADTQYQAAEFIQGLRERTVAPHISEYVHGNLGKNHLSATERSDPERSISQKKRKLIERVFGWSKLNRPLRQVKLRGLQRVDWFYRLTIAAYNLVRMRKLIPTQPIAA